MRILRQESVEEFNAGNQQLSPNYNAIYFRRKINLLLIYVGIFSVLRLSTVNGATLYTVYVVDNS